MRAIALPAASGVVGPGVAAAGQQGGSSGGFIGLMGFSISESATTAGAAFVTIREGGVATGTILAVVKLAASASETTTFQERVMSNGQLYVKYESGTVTGSLYLE